MADFDQIDDNALLFEQTLAKAHDLVHGDTSVIVQTEGGPLPSFARYMSMMVPSDQMVVSFGAAGTLAQRSAWDNASPGFTYLAENVGYVYTRLHAGGWSSGVSFRAQQWVIATTNPLSTDGETSDIWLNRSTTEMFTKTDPTTWVSRGNLSPGITDASVDDKTYVRKNGQWVELALTAYAAKNAVNSFTKAQAVTTVALVDAASIVVDATLSNTFRVTLGGNRAVANPTGMVDGQILNFIIRQDAAGSRTATWGSKFKWAGAVAPVLSTAGNSIDVVSGIYDAAADIILASASKTFA
jgi:hypothetical protein